MDKLEAMDDTVAPLNFRFDFKQKSGRFVSTLEDFSKSFGDLPVFRHSSAQIERGDKIALIGANGKGKSTLLRIIAGTEPIKGTSELGYNVNMAFYAQHQLDALNVNNEILEELKQSGSGKTEQELRNVLGCFLFHDDDVFKKIKVLSGGEKSRVALAKTLISEANFLLLDEPTNHLDMQSVQILTQALNQYQGSYIIVSHDRHFITQVANKIWFIKDLELKSYPGNYQEYEYWAARKEPSTQPAPPVKKSPKPKKKKTAARTDNPLKDLEKKLQQLENKIDQLESSKVAFEEQLSDPKVYADPEKLALISAELQTLEQKLQQLNNEWDQVAQEIDHLSNK